MAQLPIGVHPTVFKKPQQLYYMIDTNTLYVTRFAKTWHNGTCYNLQYEAL